VQNIQEYERHELPCPVFTGFPVEQNTWVETIYLATILGDFREDGEGMNESSPSFC
jgi:hypothetical protein